MSSLQDIANEIDKDCIDIRRNIKNPTHIATNKKSGEKCYVRYDAIGDYYQKELWDYEVIR